MGKIKSFDVSRGITIISLGATALSSLQKPDTGIDFRGGVATGIFCFLLPLLVKLTYKDYEKKLLHDSNADNDSIIKATKQLYLTEIGFSAVSLIGNLIAIYNNSDKSNNCSIAAAIINSGSIIYYLNKYSSAKKYKDIEADYKHIEADYKHMGDVQMSYTLFTTALQFAIHGFSGEYTLYNAGCMATILSLTGPLFIKTVANREEAEKKIQK